MAESVLNDRRSGYSASCHLTGQYGLVDVYIGVPCIIGANGVEQIFELDLTDDELSSLQGSANLQGSVEGYFRILSKLIIGKLRLNNPIYIEDLSTYMNLYSQPCLGTVNTDLNR